MNAEFKISFVRPCTPTMADLSDTYDLFNQVNAAYEAVSECQRIMIESLSHKNYCDVINIVNPALNAGLADPQLLRRPSNMSERVWSFALRWLNVRLEYRRMRKIDPAVTHRVGVWRRTNVWEPARACAVASSAYT